MKLNTLAPSPGARKQSKRVGRGPGSGLGKTATRGHKGARSRAGYSMKAGFEGGQMPLYRRLPKRGFTNIFKVQSVLITLSMLDQFESGATVDQQALLDAGLIKSLGVPVKVLANGELHKALNVKLAKFSQGAKDQIVAAGGTVEEV
ncbi:MAG: 50S ribosomal protein L15 [Desulfobulbaceae bacterium]|nr:50S ribosomal protein L15 [Desulfobulbaceae bacterium]